MASPFSAKWLAGIKVQLSLVALPVWVWPKVYVSSWLRTVFGLEQPVMNHLIANATVQWLSTSLSTEQFHTITSASASIEDMARTCPRLQQLGAISGNGFDATWIVKVPESTHLILYVHGGGFVSGSSAGTAKYLLQMFLEMEHRGLLCDILSVDYDLSPAARYPTALQQVAHAHQYIASFGKPVILMGDSAGGNLCFGLLQHLVVPNPLMENTQTSKGGNDSNNLGFSAMCLLSPWVDLRTEGQSVVKYQRFDCLNKTVLDGWVQHYLGPYGKLDCYASPAERNKNWAEVLTCKTLIVAGEMEIFVSDIMNLSSRIRADGFQSLDLVVVPRKGHAWAAVDYGFECAERPLGPAQNDSESGLVGLVLQAKWIVDAVKI